MQLCVVEGVVIQSSCSTLCLLLLAFHHHQEGRKLERNLMPFGVGVRQCIGIKLAEQEVRVCSHSMQCSVCVCVFSQGLTLLLFQLAIAGALMVQNLEFRLPKGVDSIDLRPQYGQTMHPAFYRVELVDRK